MERKAVADVPCQFFKFFHTICINIITCMNKWLHHLAFSEPFRCFFVRMFWLVDENEAWADCVIFLLEYEQEVLSCIVESDFSIFDELDWDWNTSIIIQNKNRNLTVITLIIIEVKIGYLTLEDFFRSLTSFLILVLEDVLFINCTENT